MVATAESRGSGWVSASASCSRRWRRTHRCADGDGALPHSDAARVVVLAMALERLEQVAAWVSEHGPLDRRGRPRPAADLERRLRREVAEHLDSLGMSPRARGRLGLGLAR